MINPVDTSVIASMHEIDQSPARLSHFPEKLPSFERTIQLVGRKAFLPPLGLITVAALLPQKWEMKLVDRNVREITEAEWQWADIVSLSEMIVQKASCQPCPEKPNTVTSWLPPAAPIPHP